MNTHADKTQENKSQSVANSVSHKQSSYESTFQFVDNRPESIAQRKLTEMANNSPQVSQLRDYQRMANNSSQAKPAARLQAMADNYSALQQQQQIQKKENKTGLPDNLKSGIKNNSEPAVIQAKLYVIGESHPDTNLRLEQEKEFSAEEFGNAFYLEQEYKLPGTQIPADPRALKGLRDAMIPFYYTKEFLDDSANMSAQELDEDAEYISDYIDKARYEFEELQKHPDPRFQFEYRRLETIMPKLEELDTALEELRLVLNPEETTPGEGLKRGELIADIRAKYDNLRNSIIVLHKITLSHSKRMMRELDKSRSKGMAEALISTGDEVQGVWKVGEGHIPEIREVLIEEDQEQFLPQVISEAAFNYVFLKWFETKYKIKYEEYMNERRKLK